MTYFCLFDFLPEWFSHVALLMAAPLAHSSHRYCDGRCVSWKAEAVSESATAPSVRFLLGECNDFGCSSRR